MTEAHGSTLRALTAPTVLAIGCPPDLVARCARALEGIGLGLRTCDFLNMATVVAERRPLAMVLPEDLYAFDPGEFGDLARDVQASLVRVEDDIPEAKLRLLLTTAIDTAAARRGELLPAWDDEEGTPVLETDTREMGRRTEPNPALFAYQVGQRLPSRADLAAVAWPTSSSAPPSSRPGT
jgi:hypothetical protein